MPDTASKERRSEIMQHIKGKDTTIELLVRRKLHSLGYRFRVNYKELYDSTADFRFIDCPQPHFLI